LVDRGDDAAAGEGFVGVAAEADAELDSECVRVESVPAEPGAGGVVVAEPAQVPATLGQVTRRRRRRFARPEAGVGETVLPPAEPREQRPSVRGVLETPAREAGRQKVERSAEAVVEGTVAVVDVQVEAAIATERTTDAVRLAVPKDVEPGVARQVRDDHRLERYARVGDAHFPELTAE
jgi:hypothetical protein